MKIDPHKNKERWIKWKENNKLRILRLSKENSDIILKYLKEMEKGINISPVSIKGSRSYARLNSLRNRLIFFAIKFKEMYNLDSIIKINEEQLISFFSDMKRGDIKKIDGGNYKSVDTYAKIFKAFWHWHQKVNKKNGDEIPDITIDLDTSPEKPDWVYLNEEQVKKLCDNAKYEYKVLIMFLLDTGIRAPTELVNIKVSDLYKDFKELQIREEMSKTFGRRIKLMLCSDLLKDYIKNKELKKEDYLFKINPLIANQYLKRLALKVFGNGVSEAGAKYCEISLYDFRHISCCYWLPRYKSESALKYRFGWKKSDKIHYYSELLGMKDTISEEDLLIDVTKTEIEKRLLKTEKDKEILQEKIESMEKQMGKILELLKVLGSKVQIIEVEN
ncbi:site-specific integrase [Candidatus Pacearchaeota archaeon]|nr:site-specific integrase [Candidatus Pacearchaeota archaeon]